MQHTIPVEALGPSGKVMAQAVDKCVHCGFCLPTCPTYNVLYEEMDSPRGRIILMKSVLEGDIPMEDALPYVDRCLGCQSCVTACPSGVPYGELLVPFRAYAETRRQRSVTERVARRLALETIPYPGRFRLAAKAGKMAKPISGMLPKSFQAMLASLPEGLPASRPLPEVYPAEGPRRARVALLAGCVQQALEPEINWATLRVLARNGVEVVIPRDQGCCGALALHTGATGRARSQARHNMGVFPSDVDAVLTNAAGCGSGIHEWIVLFTGTELEEAAREFAQRTMDISVFLDKLGMIAPPPLPSPVKLVYHDACHLAHAQKVTMEPRRLLGAVGNLSLAPIAEADICCGSAGTYSLEQPEMAQKLGERKTKHILATGAEGVVTGNIGCLTQLRNQMANQTKPLPVWHTIQVLDRAYAGW